ncbi:hypothetical protein ACFLUM_03845 [Chloroflexota bacterium]
MKRRRDLIVTNVLALFLLLAVYLAGLREAAAFGLVVLAFMDLMVLLRERASRSLKDGEE